MATGGGDQAESQPQPGDLTPQGDTPAAHFSETPSLEQL